MITKTTNLDIVIMAVFQQIHFGLNIINCIYGIVSTRKNQIFVNPYQLPSQHLQVVHHPPLSARCQPSSPR